MLKKKLSESGNNLFSVLVSSNLRSRYEVAREPEEEAEPVQTRKSSQYMIPDDSPEPIRKSSIAPTMADDDEDDYRPASPQFACDLCKEQFNSEKTFLSSIYFVKLIKAKIPVRNDGQVP